MYITVALCVPDENFPDPQNNEPEILTLNLLCSQIATWVERDEGQLLLQAKLILVI